MELYTSYLRVSTVSQGQSGLGIDSQKSIINNYLKGILPVNEFIDIESGTKKGNDRQGLKDALAYCKEHKTKLIIAKLDRLSRSVSFISQLMESDDEFVICDMPTANKFTIHIFSALAEQEARFISERTKSALAELKKKDRVLGTPKNLTNEARTKGTNALILKAQNNTNNKKATALIVSLRRENMSYRKIADQLNNCSFKTSTDKEFSSSQVLILFDRYNANLNIQITI